MNTKQKFLHWSPRILCILAIMFISLFALDAFDPKYTFWQQIGAFAIHMIPSFVLIGLLIIAWKWELVGGIIFAVIGIVFSPIIFIHNLNMNDSVGMSLIVILTITVPFVLIGLLFIFSHFHKRKKKLTIGDRT